MLHGDMGLSIHDHLFLMRSEKPGEYYKIIIISRFVVTASTTLTRSITPLNR